ncbi:type II toxin-antitoxin system prevent-host-death family antitoxin [Actinomadura parmotrematis]|uniref:Type II toxin-antitoxin system prevent-host-death family antitoxin n=1 Tax=Actinomadura parmotrematis TaxID=2864039 RepID=A0ABS7FPS0_9ACTN|nr:type II toxin-antitoxin system prevent-host-death family antitoxin [Actinomadura parmotrematis]MBW8482390.1 type II toxin-antitoxin system prevent-host-death family antitoxin [Actinomadura parmotrematis]
MDADAIPEALDVDEARALLGPIVRAARRGGAAPLVTLAGRPAARVVPAEDADWEVGGAWTPAARREAARTAWRVRLELDGLERAEIVARHNRAFVGGPRADAERVECGRVLRLLDAQGRGTFHLRDDWAFFVGDTTGQRALAVAEAVHHLRGRGPRDDVAGLVAAAAEVGLSAVPGAVDGTPVLTLAGVPYPVLTGATAGGGCTLAARRLLRGPDDLDLDEADGEPHGDVPVSADHDGAGPAGHAHGDV